MRKADDLQLAKHNTIFPLLLQSSKRHDEMITKMSDELRVSYFQAKFGKELRVKANKVILN